MAIKGLTDRGLSFPEIGQIRKGAPKGENKPGADLRYFRVEFDEREVETAALFKRIYGDKPAELNIILPFNEIERMWDAWLEAYTAGRLVARSDGERFIYWVDTTTGEIKVKNGLDVKTMKPVTYSEGQEVGRDYKGKPVFCKPVGRLRVIIPELARAAYLTVITTSLHDIGNLSAQLDAYAQINGGRIAGIPLVLRRRPKKISVPSANGQRARMAKWMLSIEADPTWVKAMMLEIKTNALPGNGLNLLPEAIHEPEVIEAETSDVTEEEAGDEPPSDPFGEEFGDYIPPEPESDPGPSKAPAYHFDPTIKPIAIMMLESAENTKTKNGILYKDLSNEDLEWHFRGCVTTLKNNGLSEDKRIDLEIKRDAAATVYVSRQATAV